MEREVLHRVRSAIMIMQNISCKMDWVTSTIFTWCSAQMADTLARMPTVSLPTTVMTALIIKTSVLSFIF